MPERGEDYYHHRYEAGQVITLLGLREGWRSSDARHVTVVDLLSWAQDPGGDRTFYLAALQREPGASWMARRGPFAPDSEDAAVLWDLLRAMRELSLREQAILALKAFGFSYRDIGQVLHTNKDEVSRVIWGDGRREGAVWVVLHRMNGDAEQLEDPDA